MDCALDQKGRGRRREQREEGQLAALSHPLEEPEPHTVGVNSWASRGGSLVSAQYLTFLFFFLPTLPWEWVPHL